MLRLPPRHCSILGRFRRASLDRRWHPRRSPIMTSPPTTSSPPASPSASPLSFVKVTRYVGVARCVFVSRYAGVAACVSLAVCLCVFVGVFLGRLLSARACRCSDELAGALLRLWVALYLCMRRCLRRRIYLCPRIALRRRIYLCCRIDLRRRMSMRCRLHSALR